MQILFINKRRILRFLFPPLLFVTLIVIIWITFNSGNESWNSYAHKAKPILQPPEKADFEDTGYEAEELNEEPTAKKNIKLDLNNDKTDVDNENDKIEVNIEEAKHDWNKADHNIDIKLESIEDENNDQDYNEQDRTRTTTSSSSDDNYQGDNINESNLQLERKESANQYDNDGITNKEENTDIDNETAENTDSNHVELVIQEAKDESEIETLQLIGNNDGNTADENSDRFAHNIMQFGNNGMGDRGPEKEDYENMNPNDDSKILAPLGKTVHVMNELNTKIDNKHDFEDNKYAQNGQDTELFPKQKSNDTQKSIQQNILNRMKANLQKNEYEDNSRLSQNGGYSSPIPLNKEDIHQQSGELHKNNNIVQGYKATGPDGVQNTFNEILNDDIEQHIMEKPQSNLGVVHQESEKELIKAGKQGELEMNDLAANLLQLLNNNTNVMQLEKQTSQNDTTISYNIQPSNDSNTGDNTFNDEQIKEIIHQEKMRAQVADAQYYNNTENGDTYLMKDIFPISNYKNPCWYERSTSSESKSDAKLRCLPYFFLTGISTCGEDLLLKLLSIHHQIVTPLNPKPNWWTVMRLNNEPFTEAYLNNYDVPAHIIQHSLTENSEGVITHNKVTLDASPNLLVPFNFWQKFGKYMEKAESKRFFSPYQIQKILPNSKIIVLLCDPVERLYAWYNNKYHDDYGTEHSPSDFDSKVERAIEWLFNCTKEHNTSHICHFGQPDKWNKPDPFITEMQSGFYGYLLQMWYDVFPHENIKVISVGDLMKNRLLVMYDLIHFLDLDPVTVHEQQLILLEKITHPLELDSNIPPMLLHSKHKLQSLYKYSNELFKFGNDQYNF